MPATTSKKKPQDRKPKTKQYGGSWKSNLTDLELPSGELCQVRRPGIPGLIKAGILHSMDSLTAIVETETIPKAAGKPPIDIKGILKDEKKFEDMMLMVDKIVCHVVTQPKVLPIVVPVLEADGSPKKNPDTGEAVTETLAEDDDRRDPEAIYVDYIDYMDKMFIMNFAVGGSRDLQQFRKATEALVGGAHAGEGAEDAS
jgi:hypothetical protein